MRHVLTMLVLAVMLTGCGLRGPLYMPGTKPPAKQPAKPSAPTPPTNQDANP